jgi:predicted ATPase
MLTKLRLKNFKNFKDAELHLGGFTVLLGTNAAGKSNIRDAIRFLNGIGQGYNLPEILGGKFIESGVLQWRGIRGGVQEIVFCQEKEFTIEADFTITYKGDVLSAAYSVSVRIEGGTPKVMHERLTCEGLEFPVFEAVPLDDPGLEHNLVHVRFYDQWNEEIGYGLWQHQAILAQTRDISLIQWNFERSTAHKLMLLCSKALLRMRFPDLNPEKMRQPSVRGQVILSDQGENLSSVIANICRTSDARKNFVEWIRALTPMDVKDLEFIPDISGKIYLQFAGENGHSISAASASDGTLKFLGILATFLSSDLPLANPPAPFSDAYKLDRVIFLEELENGIHATRLHLLLQLIEQQAQQGKVQTIATTHSPELLRLLSEESLQNVSLIYRLDDRPDAQIQRLVDIPHFQDVLDGSDLGELLESGWLETTMSFQRDEVAIG